MTNENTLLSIQCYSMLSFYSIGFRFMVFNATFNNISAICTSISWREQVNFQLDDDEVRFVLDQHAELDFYSQY